MATQKQIIANRKNAKKGGVKTPEGKAIVRYNALKHGLLSKEVLLPNENKQELIELGKRLRAEIIPQTELEKILVDRIVANIWRLKRALKVERNMISFEYKREYHHCKKWSALNSDDWKNETEFKEQGVQAMINNEMIERLIRYETTIERSIYKALHELQRIQAARAGRKPPAPLAIDIDISGNK